jgi:protein phosphatase
MQFLSHGISDQGKVRNANEDAFLINTSHQVFAVADGLGGLPGGAEASQRIIELLKQTCRQIDADHAYADLGDLIASINHTLTEEGKQAYPLSGFGSTLTIAQLHGDQLQVGHVGDSAAYHLRDNNFHKITTDHTMEQALIERIGERARDMMPPAYPHTLTRCLGITNEVKVDQLRLTIAAGDRLLLCTDGLNKVVAKQHIHTTLPANASPKQICRDLIHYANAQGGPDNITVIVVFIQ